LHRDVDLLLPVPLHPGKLVERGFNQSIEIARWVARETQRPCEARTLARTRSTRPQVGLPLVDRVANLQGAFEVPGPVRDRRVAVIDDVMTTGSTVREIAWALRRAGAGTIDVWCVARTPG
jgi:ComF family protein